uniref:Prolyl 4-hydroxylase alpha subunit domain-containing protein n=3 Tax=Lotharella globosa TaxID=91324 RepID=A0A7S4DZF3_9EUKA|mmetsp:Transcript_14573/g.27495  ORF Transcript_14573/g.27495 Transcript_14573/m.27495 type:complete len:334 (-) Transcript_14573:15-1016(-)
MHALVPTSCRLVRRIRSKWLFRRLQVKRDRGRGFCKESLKPELDEAKAARIGLIAAAAFIGVPMAATFLTWQFVSKPENVAHESEEARHRRFRQWGLPLPAEAQASQVHYIRNFLSKNEIAHLMDVVSSMQREGFPGVVNRQSPGKPWLHTTWRTTYLHTNGAFEQRLPLLGKKLRQAFADVDRREWNLIPTFDPSSLHFRTVEFHEYWPGGQLSQAQHYDSGSIITMDIMLADPNRDYKGGDLVTPEIDGTRKYHQLQKGDAAFFLSHKYHNVLPITEGKRMVLVVELWSGPERVCPHRCWSRGVCQRKVGENSNNTAGAVAAAAENGWLLG